MATTTTTTTIDSIEDVSDAEGIADVSVEPQPVAPEPAFPVHPLAASFPMLEGEELDALVDDIRANGLLNPIVLDTSGQLIDGRNRLNACKLAGVEPTFVTREVDPIAYILSLNVHRRHLSKGQQAMAYAMAYPESSATGGRGNKAYSENTVSRDYIAKARFVLHHAPDLAAKVMAGSSLTEAYALAAEQKRECEQNEQLRTDVRERLDAIVAVCTRLKLDTEKPTAFLDQGDFVQQVRADTNEIIEHAKKLVDTV
jgi:hypothetical protein